MTPAQTKILARTISLVENGHTKAVEILNQLKPNATRVIGITGPPGAGKSTLVNQLIKEYLLQKKKIGVLLVDPSSAFNKGALLGDRIRMVEHFKNPDVFIRSVASRGSLGGLSETIIEVCDVMKQADFDYILVETVGVGQSEVEIVGLADCCVVVLVPEAGDEIQNMKSGVMEIGSLFIINKADRPDATTFAVQLKKYLQGTHEHYNTPVLLTEAHNGIGIATVAAAVEVSLHNTSQKQKLALLLQKALHLIRKEKMKDIDEEALLLDLKQLLDDNRTEKMYALIQKYY